uniref:Tumour necrosis factor receptor 13C TALL-1 binding domain-containing protein n=1 Tax=Anas platyrhynchos TaxID=8839 RepID=A0A8B9QXR5_ANAPL
MRERSAMASSGKADAVAACLPSQCFDPLTRFCVRCSDLFKDNATEPVHVAPTSAPPPTLSSVDLPSTLLLFGVPALVVLLLVLAALCGLLGCKASKQRRKRRKTEQEAKESLGETWPPAQPRLPGPRCSTGGGRPGSGPLPAPQRRPEGSGACPGGTAPSGGRAARAMASATWCCWPPPGPATRSTATASRCRPPSWAPPPWSPPKPPRTVWARKDRDGLETGPGLSGCPLQPDRALPRVGKARHGPELHQNWALPFVTFATLPFLWIACL